MALEVLCGSVLVDDSARMKHHILGLRSCPAAAPPLGPQQKAPPLLAALPWTQGLATRLAHLDLPAAATVGMNFGITLFALLVMLPLLRPNRRTFVVANAFLIAAIILTPLLQSQAVVLAATRIDTVQAAQATDAKARDLQQKAADVQSDLRNAAPYTPPQTVQQLPDPAPAAPTP